MSRALLSFLGGMGKGAMDQMERTRVNERQDRLDEMRIKEFNYGQELRDLQLDQAKQDAQDKKDERAAIAAPTPTPVPVDMVDANNASEQAAAFSMPADQQNGYTAGSGTKQKTFTMSDGGLKAATDYTTATYTPEEKQAMFLETRNPQKAAQIRADVLTRKNSALAQSQAQEDRAYTLQKEGTFDALKAFSAGDIRGGEDAYSRGQFRVKGTTLTPVERVMPWGEKMTTYNVETTQVDTKTGKETPVSFNTHDARMAGMLFEKIIESQQKNAELKIKGYVGKSEEKKNIAYAGALDRKEGSVGTKTERPVGPKFTKTKDQEGNEYMVDENSGAIGTFQAAIPGTPGEVNSIFPDKPAIPGRPAGYSWTTADGRPLPQGPQVLYKQLPVNNPGALPQSQPAPLPPKLFVGATTRQADGAYSANGRTVVIQGGKVTEIK